MRLLLLAASLLALAGSAQAVVLFSNPGPITVDETGAGSNLAGMTVSRGAFASDTLYFEFVVEPISDFNDENYYAGLALYQGPAAIALLVGNGNASPVYSAFSMTTGDVDLYSSSPDVPAGSQLVRDTDVTTIVFKVEYDPSGLDHVTVWLNPDPAKSEAAQPANLTTTFDADASFDQIHLREGAGAAGWTFRDIVIGTTDKDTGSFGPAIIYSGPERNIVWQPANSLDPGPISLAGDAGTWDDMALGCNDVFGGSFHGWECRKLLGADGNHVQFAAPNSDQILRLSAGQKVDASRAWSRDWDEHFTRFLDPFDPIFLSTSTGEFRNPSPPNYAGIRMTRGADVYFGWVGVTVLEYSNANISLIVRDWAFWDTPNLPIDVGQTAAYSDLTDSDLDGVVDLIDNCPGLANPDQEDTDSDGPDGVGDVCDNCPTVANGLAQAAVIGVGNQTNGSVAWTVGQQLESASPGGRDEVGDACDNCVTRNNPRRAPDFLTTTGTWATLSGGQRDDDHDGYGNSCDPKLPWVAGTNVNLGDTSQVWVSLGGNRTGDTCGTTNSRPCAVFDFDEAATNIGLNDMARANQWLGRRAGPRCPIHCTGLPTGPLPCTAGTAGSCDPIP